MKLIAYRGFLRVSALIALAVGALGSVCLMLHVGQRNDSKILLAIFTIWVFSPFIALAGIYAFSRRWPVFAQASLYSVMLIVTLSSLVIYGDVAFGRPWAKPAFPFLVVPLVSWLLIAIIVSIAVIRRKRE